MQRLDKSKYSSGNLSNPQIAKEQYKGYGFTKLLEVAFYLNSVAFNYPLNNPPRLDKTAFSSRKLQ